ncbi:MAG: tannase/feruloyl esterase family alpha/beta hydrolase [Acidobacteria bacterium]|nr:tannase/feruloyl esterase family alpha/beta hydrolase [Acidobacteriota bacterium]
MRLMLFAATMLCAAADCDSLAKLTLKDTRIVEAVSVPAGDFKTFKGLPAFCRVAGVIAPTTDSEIKFEAWLPASGWNGKFLGVGNGGFAGSISFGGLAEALRTGFASASTDTGHSAGGTDASWALRHPEKAIDFGHRAIHLMTVQGKAITTAFYGTAPKKSYFSSCSNGGRQALMEAQRYPEDYDGIVAGAPANYWTHLMSNAAKNSKATLRDAEAYFPSAKLPAIQAAALQACDRNDGVGDGVVENPGACKFDPAVLLCKGAEDNSCLTQAQLGALKEVYGGLRDGKGKLVYPGYAPSGEAENGGWGAWITGPEREKSALFAFSTNFFKNIVHSDPGWDYKAFDAAKDLQAAKKVAPVFNATDPNLKAFHARGGKLILYHGWCDAAIPGQAVIDYYDSVVKKMGAKQTGQFVRLFMVPGMQHCGGGAGPNNFGQGTAPKGDPSTNIGAALMNWVENGTAPERLVASRQGRTRPLCAYPKTAKYKGTGSTDDAANFECVR